MKIIIEIPENVDGKKLITNIFDACNYIDNVLITCNGNNEYIDKAKLDNINEDNPINNIDWELLKKQKNTLLNLENCDIFNSIIKDDLNGLISLIDSIQDYGVDKLGLNEGDIFNFIE